MNGEPEKSPSVNTALKFTGPDSARSCSPTVTSHACAYVGHLTVRTVQVGVKGDPNGAAALHAADMWLPGTASDPLGGEGVKLAVYSPSPMEW